MAREFTVHDVDQRSDAWHHLRAPNLNSSEVADIFKAGKGSAESVSKRNLRMQKALAWLSGHACADGDGYVSKAMQRGIDKEPAARMAYEAQRGVLVSEAGYLSHNTLRIGASLDGYVGNFEGLVEFKCPESTTHWANFQAQAIPSDYLHQIRHQLLITGAEWCDFVSFDDRFPEPAQLVIVRLLRKDAELGAHEKAVRAFLNDVQREVETMQTALDLSAQLKAAACA